MSQYLDKDGASRIAENFLSKQAEQDAILQNLQFDLKEAEHALVKTIQGPAPLNIRALTRPLDDYLISGNTVQNGTPTPEAPVDVVGCGVRTENLFDGFDYYGVVPSINNGNNADYPAGASTDYIEVDNPLITLSKDSSFGNARIYIFLYDDNKIFIGYAVSNTTEITSRTISNYTSAKFARVRVDSYHQYAEQYMLNTGSTALPHEPYGYKLPLTVNSTEYPIYLGNVQTTRRIRKLVLTGNEKLHVYNRNGYVTISDGLMQTIAPYCDILPGTTSPSAESPDSVKQLETTIEGTSCSILFKVSTGFSNIDNFRAWLEENTPTVWYVLATPEIGIVNEPLHKIGDYADTISMAQAGVEISTTKGFNTITTGTTVLPSNIEVKGVINNA